LRESDPNDPNEIEEEEQQAPSWSQRPWFWMLVLLLGVFTLTNLFSNKIRMGAIEVESTRLFSEVERGNVDKLEEAEQEVFVAVLRSNINVTQGSLGAENSVEAEKIFANIPGEIQKNLFEMCTDQGVPVIFLTNTTPAWQVVVTGFLPILILVLFFWWMSNRVRRQMGWTGNLWQVCRESGQAFREG